MKTYIPILVAVVLVVLGTGAWVVSSDGRSFIPSIGTVRPSSISGEAYTGPSLQETYRNEIFHFTIAIPEGFTVGELPPDENGGTAIVLQNEKGEGIQIYVVSAGETAKILTAEDIRRTIPDMAVENPEVVEIGREYSGVAFISNNEAYEGRSREVWFYFKGNLYQISTYARLDTLLKAMFATWTFF
ncbi:MAG: hypothetical protein WBK28_01335 [Minisyncoccia bacterium]